MLSPYAILARKRAGLALDAEAIGEIVQGAVDGSWSEGQLGAFLMATAIRGMDLAETRELTRAMLESGERWQLAQEVPRLGDKHSTGGVGDTVTLILGPLLAACGIPMAMLTGRSLGHTGGTADKLECVPGVDLELDRERTLALLDRTGLAIGVATRAIAPADRRLYALRDTTATVESLPLIVASILSKKLATGAAAVAFDVKVGNGAFLSDPDEARALARLLSATARELGTAASALLTDMSQPLGRWSGHHAELIETFDALEGRGPADTMAVVEALALELSELLGVALSAADLDAAIASGRARERFVASLVAQGARPAWFERPALPLAPCERVITAEHDGFLARVDTKRLGLLLGEAGAGRRRSGDAIDPGVALESSARLGDRVEAGRELARVYLRHDDEALWRRFAACYELSEETLAPPRLIEKF